MSPEPPPLLKVTQEMVDSMRINVIVFTSAQLVIMVAGMVAMMFITNVPVQIILVLTAATYSMVMHFIIATKWRVFLARLLVLN